jgi:hypothetical protein
MLDEFSNSIQRVTQPPEQAIWSNPHQLIPMTSQKFIGRKEEE